MTLTADDGSTPATAAATAGFSALAEDVLARAQYRHGVYRELAREAPCAVRVRIDGGDLTYDAVDRLVRAGVAPLIDEIFIRFKGGGFFHEYVQINGEWQVINEPPPPRNQLQKVYFEWKDLVSSVHPWPG